MATILTPDQLKARFTGQTKSLAYNLSCEYYHKLRVHAEGEVPIHLIKKARPNESEEVRKYREGIYEAETLNPIERVFGVLEKIRRSPDWNMRFDGEVPKIIIPEETLPEYLNNNYPIYGSFEDWLFEEALRNAGLDANGVIAVIPDEFDVPETEYVKPVAKIFNCDHVVNFVAEDYAVLKSDELSSLLTPERQQQRLDAPENKQNIVEIANNFYGHFATGQVYYHINTFQYEKWEENMEGKYTATQVYRHGLDGLPVFQMPGKYVKRIGNNIVKKTPIYPMVPHLNKAARESNDLDAGVVKHLHLKEWRINNIPCQKCSGTTKVPSTNGAITCPDCKGTGMSNGTSPFGVLYVKPEGLAEKSAPIPPMGYVDMNPEIIKIQNDRIKEHIYKALECVNMEHLADVQLNQSGTAKAYDKDEATTLVYVFAEYLTAIANASIYWINELRYKDVVADVKKRAALLPVISVPEKFDVISTSFLITEYQTAKNSGLSSTILSQLQMEIVQKKFYATPNISSFVQTVMEINPFPDKTAEEVGYLSSQGLISKEDAVLSVYISDFVSLAVEQDLRFLEKTKKEKRDLLMKYAKEKVEQMDQAKQIMTDLFQTGTKDEPQEQTAA